MPDPTPKPALDRAAFAARLAEAGIVLDADEFEAVYGTANWVEAGLAALPAADVAAGAEVDEALADLSIVEAGRRLREGTLTAVALTAACLARIRSRDGAYHAFTALLDASALAAARAADAALAEGRDLGPLHGIPVGMKDLIDVAGVRTTAGSRGRAEAAPATAHATLVERLVAGGAVIIGKLATYEWATVGPAWDTLHPPAANPWSLDHITGGSSSGCAAAVAGGLLRTSIGTDTGGSMRGPSSYCGTVGLKPTYGLVPMDGVLPLSPSMDTAGVIAASSAEAALTLDVIAGTSGARSAARRLATPVTGLRIGYARDWFADDVAVHPAVVAAMDAAASVLSERGALVQRVTLPPYGPIEVAAAAVLLRESYDLHRAALAADAAGYGRKTYQSLVGGAAISDAQLAAARTAGVQFGKALDTEILSDFDAVITVCALTPALPLALFGKGSVWTPMRTIPFNLSGHPVLALPIGFADGLPLGMQIIGKPHDEALICQIGAAFELGSDFALQRPPQPPR